MSLPVVITKPNPDLLSTSAFRTWAFFASHGGSVGMCMEVGWALCGCVGDASSPWLTNKAGKPTFSIGFYIYIYFDRSSLYNISHSLVAMVVYRGIDDGKTPKIFGPNQTFCSSLDRCTQKQLKVVLFVARIVSYVKESDCEDSKQLACFSVVINQNKCVQMFVTLCSSMRAALILWKSQMKTCIALIGSQSD